MCVYTVLVTVATIITIIINIVIVETRVPGGSKRDMDYASFANVTDSAPRTTTLGRTRTHTRRGRR